MFLLTVKSNGGTPVNSTLILPISPSSSLNSSIISLPSFILAVGQLCTTCDKPTGLEQHPITLQALVIVTTPGSPVRNFN